jgi:hypothetical protein
VVGIFRQKTPVNSLLLLVYALVLKFPVLLRPRPPLQQQEDHYLYGLLMRFLLPLQLPPSIYTFIAFLIVFFQATLLNRIFSELKMLPKPNFLPGMVFILLTTLFSEWNYFSAPLLANGLLIFMFYRIVNLYNTASPLGGVFNIGVMMGLVSLLYQPAILFVILIPFSLFIMRPFRVREWLISFLGLTTPYYFLALEPLFTNRWSWKYLIPFITIDFPAMPAYVFITVSIMFMVIPFIVGGYYVQSNLNKMLIQARKGWSVLLLFLIVSSLIILVNGGGNYVNWVFCVMPLAAFHAAAYYYPDKPRFPVIMHWIIFAYALYLAYWATGYFR